MSNVKKSTHDNPFIYRYAYSMCGEMRKEQMGAASEQANDSEATAYQCALSFVEDCYRNDKGEVLQLKFDELSASGVMEDGEEWQDSPWYKAMTFLESEGFPQDLKSQGYRGWLDYWCRTEVPEDYRCEMLCRSAEPCLDEWPVPSLWKPLLGEHPVLSGFNPMALALVLNSGAYPEDKQRLSVHQLYEHWDWGLKHGRVSEAKHTQAMELIGPWFPRPARERVLPTGWRKEVVLNTPGYFQGKLSSFLSEHAHLEFNYKGYKMTPVVYVIHKMLREDKTHYAHGLHHLGLSKGGWDRVKEQVLCDGLTGQDLLNFFDYLPMGQLGWAKEKKSFEADQLSKKEEVLSLFENVLEHRRFEGLFDFMDDYWFKSVWMNPVINTKKDVLGVDDVRRSLRILCSLYHSALVKAASGEEVNENNLWGFLCDKHVFLEKMLLVSNEKLSHGQEQWRQAVADIQQYLDVHDARRWYSLGVARVLWKEFIQKMDRSLEDHDITGVESHEYWLSVWKEKLEAHPVLKGKRVLNPAWLKEMEGMELRKELMLKVKGVDKTKGPGWGGSRF